MKILQKTLLILLTLVTLNSCNKTKVSKTTEPSKKEALLFSIDNKNAGQFTISKKVPKNLENKISTEFKTRSKSEEGTTWTENYIEVSENKNELLSCIITDNDSTIVSIIIKSSKFKTANNIGVNSSITAFTEAYPKYAIWYSYIGDVFVIESKSLNIQFVLNKEDFIGNKKALNTSDLVSLKISDFKPNAKIKSINLF